MILVFVLCRFGQKMASNSEPRFADVAMIEI
jgi:hypothetical protein